MTSKEKLKLAKRIGRHPAPPVQLTTPVLTPVEKAILRRRLRADKLLQKTAKRLLGQESVLRTLPCSDVVN